MFCALLCLILGCVCFLFALIFWRCWHEMRAIMHEASNHARKCMVVSALLSLIFALGAVVSWWFRLS